MNVIVVFLTMYSYSGYLLVAESRFRDYFFSVVDLVPPRHLPQF